MRSTTLSRVALVSQWKQWQSDETSVGAISVCACVWAIVKQHIQKALEEDKTWQDEWRSERRKRSWSAIASSFHHYPLLCLFFLLFLCPKVLEVEEVCGERDDPIIIECNCAESECKAIQQVLHHSVCVCVCGEESRRCELKREEERDSFVFKELIACWKRKCDEIVN